MDIIMHYPCNEAGNSKIQKSLAVVHAQAIRRYIKDLSLNESEQHEIINAISHHIEK